MILKKEDFRDARARWLRGLCPCCGAPPDEWEHYRTGEVTEPKAIAEDVVICGRCIANDHLEPDGFVEFLLASLIP